MENVSYIGLSHQMAIKNQMDVTANNIANMSTPGFKAQDVLFLEYVSEPKKGDKVSQVLDQSSFRRTGQGPLTTTGNPLDLALQGQGYFAIENGTGTTYTRAGNFMLNNKNELVTSSGLRVLNRNDAAINIPVGETQISITSNGVISTETGEKGRLKIVEFENEQDLVEIGDNMFEAVEQQAEISDNTTVHQGMIERSNVQPIIEMNKMIEGLRQYQSVQNMLQKDHDRQRSAIQKLTRVN